MDTREARGIELAKAARIKKRPAGTFIVPSATNAGSYIVEVARDVASTCSCPDFELRGEKCKHIWAVEYATRTETLADGTIKTVTTKRVSYTQEWTSYNLAQTTEKERVAELLRDLCRGVSQPSQAKGRPRLPLADMIFAATMKVYGTMSARRTDTDMREWAAKGYLSRAPHFNSVLGYLEDPTLTPILASMIEESARPLASVERDFAADSSGFSTCTYVRWFDEKYGKAMSKQQWIKAHIMVGVNTQIVTAIRVTPKEINDAPVMPELIATTAKSFPMRDVMGDKGYLSHANHQAIVDAGASPYIAFKANSTLETRSHTPQPELWKRLLGLFLFQRPTFLAHYNQRSNVETAFSMIKRKFGPALRAKSDVGQVNELLAKVLCHNLCCLVSAIYELGLVPTFWAGSPDAQKVAGK